LSIDWQASVIDQNVYRITQQQDSEGKKLMMLLSDSLLIAINSEYQKLMNEYEKQANCNMLIS